jgi:hypothetical protein
MTDNWINDPRTKAMVRLLIECRDTLPAISITSARLHNVDLTLADRIEEVLKPWEIPADEQANYAGEML